MDARETYETRRKQALADDARLDPWSAVFGNGRVVLVAAAIILLVATGFGRLGALWPAYGGLAATFVLLLVLQGAVDRRRRLAQRRAAFYAHGLDRLDGRWTTFPSTGADVAGLEHPYARDLDVVGPGSLFQLLDTTRTGQGERTLAGWLVAPGALADIEERRAAARALGGDVDARERLALAAAEEQHFRVKEEPLVAWAEGPALFAAPPWLRPLAFVLPALTLALLSLAYEGVVQGWLPALLVAGELALLRTRRDRVRRLAAVAEHAERDLSRLLPILEAACTQPRTTPALERLHASLAGAVEAVGSLRRRVTFFQSRANLLLAFVGPLLLWDLHAAMLLEGWQARAGRSLRGWLRALGELEALQALATYAFEHKADSWPELVDGPLAFEALGLGHALLASDRCVRNDVRLAGPGSALLVTGSNMSGKSTLLRATGLAAVMALAGLPVRATRLRLSRLQVATCMRVSDSLQEGASFFLAEVRRLKGVVDLARGSLPVLFLLDEILQGTNTRERSLGARGVVAHLVRTGATGLVSTHDLSLVQLGDVLGDRLAYAHFTDHVEGDQMVFDYRMRPGVVQSSNALRVMRANGLDVELPAEEAGAADRGVAPR